MRTCLLALAFGVASASARGRGVGIVPVESGGSWNAPWYIQATLAFYIIWAIVSLAQFMLILFRIKSVPPIITLAPSLPSHKAAPSNQPYPQTVSSTTGNIRSRLPYILLAVITALLTLAYILWAALERTGLTAQRQTLVNLVSATNFFLYFNFPGHAAVLLWLTHQRAQHFHFQAQLRYPHPFKHPKPFVLRSWKRYLDWILVSITYIFGLAWVATLSAWNNASLHSPLLYGVDYRNAVNGLGLALSAMVVILAIDVTVTLVALYWVERKQRYKDPIMSRLLFVCIPFLVLFALEWLSIEIVEDSGTVSRSYFIYLFQAVFEGICSVAITLGCILTMQLYDPALSSFDQFAQGMVWNGMGQYGQQPGFYGGGMGPYGQHPGVYGPNIGQYGHQQGWNGVGIGQYGPQQGWYGPNMGQYGQQQGWYGHGMGMKTMQQGESPRQSPPQGSGMLPSASPPHPPNHNAGVNASPPNPAPSSSTGTHERAENVQPSQPFKIPGNN